MTNLQFAWYIAVFHISRFIRVSFLSISVQLYRKTFSSRDILFHSLHISNRIQHCRSVVRSFRAMLWYWSLTALVCSSQTSICWRSWLWILGCWENVLLTTKHLDTPKLVLLCCWLWYASYTYCSHIIFFIAHLTVEY